MQLTLLLFVIFALMAPGLVIVLSVGAWVFLPVYLTASSFLTVMVAPRQMLTVARDKRIRRVHSCEHATVNILEEWFGPQPRLGGVATEDGFYLWGAEEYDPATLLRASSTGLERMKCGESFLAYHGRCGTSLLMARFVFALAFLAIFTAIGHFTLGSVFFALASSWILNRPLGVLAQRYLTTSPEVRGIKIMHISWSCRPPIVSGGLSSIPAGAYYVRTRQLGALSI